MTISEEIKDPHWIDYSILKLNIPSRHKTREWFAKKALSDFQMAGFLHSKNSRSAAILPLSEFTDWPPLHRSQPQIPHNPAGSKNNDHKTVSWCSRGLE